MRLRSLATVGRNVVDAYCSAPRLSAPTSPFVTNQHFEKFGFVEAGARSPSKCHANEATFQTFFGTAPTRTPEALLALPEQNHIQCRHSYEASFHVDIRLDNMLELDLQGSLSCAPSNDLRWVL